MKQLFQTLTLTLLIAGLLFSSCKKEQSCEDCINGNRPPTAIAGPDQVITLPMDSITLDGSASYDPDGTISNYIWRKIEGPGSPAINNSAVSKTIVRNLQAGSYRFELKVTDNGGLSAQDTVQIIVNDPTQPNRQPVAIAGADQTITLPANTITLDGSASTDPDNNIANYTWTKISGPASFNIANANSVQTQVTNLADGIYSFELKVTDAGGLVARDTTQITVLSSNPNFSNVYIAGWSYNTSGKTLAGIWNNGTTQNLSNGQFNAQARSVFVSGTDVYVAGWEVNANGKSVAKLWKNGVAQNLSNGQYDAEAKSVFVSGPDVYVAGWEVNTSGKSVAQLWKNGVGQSLSDGQNYAMANSVYVANSDVYIAGFDWGDWIYWGQPLLWKNGVAQNLGGNESSAYSVFVSGNDLYVAGAWLAGEFAKLWKNGVQQNFSSGDQYSEAYSVFASGSDVYVAGTRYPCAVGGCSDALLWKNGQPIFQLADAGANSVFVSGNNVYVAGYIGINAMLWKNGTGYSISGLHTASSVFVQ